MTLNCLFVNLDVLCRVDLPKHLRRKVNHLDLPNKRSDFLFESFMGGILFYIISSVCFILEFDNKRVRDPVLTAQLLVMLFVSE